MMNEFQSVAHDYDIVDLIAKKPARLKRSFDLFVDMLNDFKRDTIINAKFFSLAIVIIHIRNKKYGIYLL